ncbi:MAG: DinB family protein [Acidobacteriaceae bacterium]|nr:DinB family protein [Acidobacteriaceae bacterium]MBV9780450.1 DinB family protein [Acidobacteriaceae bacterium]
MNPYASALGNRDPFQVVANTPQQLARLFDSLGPERIEQSLVPGKWSPRQIVSHLADAEVAFAFRLRQALAEDHHVIQPFDQDKWANTYMGYEARTALDTFSSLRNWNLAFIRSVPKEAFSKPVTHPERGHMTFRTLVETMAGHDLNHVRQLEAFASKS